MVMAGTSKGMSLGLALRLAEPSHQKTVRPETRHHRHHSVYDVSLEFARWEVLPSFS